MPITTGSLTARLGQLLTDISVFFTTANGTLADIRTTLNYLTSDTAGMPNRRNLNQLLLNIQAVRGADVDFANLADLLMGIREIRNAIGETQTDPSVRTSLRYLTQSGDGTPLQRNLQYLSDEVFRLGGALPNHATLFDLRQALVSPTGPRLQEIVEKLDILLDEKLGTPPNALTGLELLQLVADCVCELNDKFPPIEPPPSDPMIPAAHLCAPDAPLLFTIEPADWYEWQTGLWNACPSSLGAGMAEWEIVQRTAVGQSGAFFPVLKVKDGQRPNALAFCNVTGATTGEISVLIPQHGSEFDANPGIIVGFTEGADVAGVTNAANGCKTIALLSSTVEEIYWRLQADQGGLDNSDFLNETLYFYEVTPN